MLFTQWTAGFSIDFDLTRYVHRVSESFEIFLYSRIPPVPAITESVTQLLYCLGFQWFAAKNELNIVDNSFCFLRLYLMLGDMSEKPLYDSTCHVALAYRSNAWLLIL